MNKITTIQQLRRRLEQLFPIGTDDLSITIWLQENGFEYSALEEGKIYASKVYKRFLLITAKWLVIFHFDECQALEKIHVEEGYIGL